jgi:uncharacterized protein YyaL (SSP411 family)
MSIQLLAAASFSSSFRAIARQWEAESEEIINKGDSIMKAIGDATAKATTASCGAADVVKSKQFVEGAAKKCFSQLLQRYDPEMGGFSSSPKFPTPVNMNFLFRMYAEVCVAAEKLDCYMSAPN